jgi:hypothetical protein
MAPAHPLVRGEAFLVDLVAQEDEQAGTALLASTSFDR